MDIIANAGNQNTQANSATNIKRQKIKKLQEKRSKLLKELTFIEVEIPRKRQEIKDLQAERNEILRKPGLEKDGYRLSVIPDHIREAEAKIPQLLDRKKAIESKELPDIDIQIQNVYNTRETGKANDDNAVAILDQQSNEPQDIVDIDFS